MEKIIRDLKESAGILEEMMEDGDLKDDLLISKGYHGHLYLSDISEELKRVTNNLLSSSLMESIRRK